VLVGISRFCVVGGALAVLAAGSLNLTACNGDGSGDQNGRLGSGQGDDGGTDAATPSPDAPRPGPDATTAPPDSTTPPLDSAAPPPDADAPDDHPAPAGDSAAPPPDAPAAPDASPADAGGDGPAPDAAPLPGITCTGHYAQPPTDPPMVEGNWLNCGPDDGLGDIPPGPDCKAPVSFDQSGVTNNNTVTHIDATGHADGLGTPTLTVDLYVYRAGGDPSVVFDVRCTGSTEVQILTPP
jgi:hypothetical protein